LSKVLHLLLLLYVGFFIPFLHLLIMELEASLGRMAGLRIGLLVFLPLIVNPILQIVPKELGESLPGV
jgi:hypothetical protein